ncbi:MAG: InlB B-repeat-containing protein [Candidatus Nanoarchaeia archaeon]
MIRRFLLQNRYPQNAVDSALLQAKRIIESQAQGQVNQAQAQKPMSQSQQQSPYMDQRYYGLLNFVKQQLARGFDTYSIKNHLLSYGYPPPLVEKVINDASPKVEINHKVDLSGKTIAFFLMLFLLIISISGIFMFFPIVEEDEVEPLLDYSLKSLDNEIERNDYLRYTQKYTNIGGMEGFDVFGNYTIQNIHDPDIIYNWGDSIGIDRLENHHSKIKLPKRLPEGDYVLRAVVEYKGKIARAHDSFSIVDEKKPSEETYGLNISASEGGTTSPEPGLNEHDEGEVIFVDAIADDDWAFSHWEGDFPQGEKNETQLAITLDENKSVTAIFKEETEPKDSFTLQIESGEGGHTVPDTGESEHGAGETVEVEAIANDGWAFSHWEGDYPAGYFSEEKLAFEIENDKSIIAKFEEKEDEDDDNESIVVDIGGMAEREIIKEVSEIDEKEKGLAMCNEITDESFRDDCYKSLATGVLNNSQVCDEMSSMSSLDSCYMEFVREYNDFSLCDKLYNNYRKHSCDLLKNAYEREHGDEDTDNGQDPLDFNESDDNITQDSPTWDNIKQDTITLDDQDDLLDAISDLETQDSNLSGEFDTDLEFCETIDCFNEHFSNCTSANFLSEEDEEKTAIYEILEEDDNGCRVRTFISEHSNETYIDNSMQCTYDNNLNWTEALNAVIESFETDEQKGDCTGELYDVMNE